MILKIISPSKKAYFFIFYVSNINFKKPKNEENY